MRDLAVVLPFILRGPRSRRPQAVQDKTHHYCSARALILVLPTGEGAVLRLFLQPPSAHCGGVPRLAVTEAVQSVQPFKIRPGRMIVWQHE